MRNRDKPANGEYKRHGEIAVQKGGLTKREEAAMRNAAHMIAEPSYNNMGAEDIALWAVKMADALFDELDGEGK